MTLPLELGQVSDPSARRALEQISLRWPQSGGGGGGGGGGVDIVSSLPPTGTDGDEVYLTSDGSEYVWYAGGWHKISPGPQGPTGPQGVPGATGPAGRSMVVYEQASEPMAAVDGDIWVDTDAPIPVGGLPLTYAQESGA